MNRRPLIPAKAFPARTRNSALALTIVLALGTISAPASAANRDPVPTLAEQSSALEAISARVRPGVVQILVSGYGLREDEEGGGYGQRQGSGSGFVLDSDGYILTNAHVIEGAQRIQVRVPPAPGARGPARSIVPPTPTLAPAQVVGMDRETDLAVLKVARTGLRTVRFGDSDAIGPGAIVLAFGFPLGLDHSVTMGVVSGLGRQLRAEDPVVYIQTDTPINPGNSGGPLVNANGEVVGVNTLIFSRSGGSEGIGFALPSNIASAVYEQIRAAGRVRRGLIGVNAQTITPTLARALNLPQDWGVLIGDVDPGGPANQAGLEVGDIVLTLDGKTMENGRQFNVNVYQRKVGERVTLELLRNGRNVTAQVPVIERPDDPDRFAGLVTPDRNLVLKLGILALSLDPEIAGKIPSLRERAGVLVAASAPGAPWSAGLQPGDVIHRVNAQPISGLEDLRAVLALVPPGGAVAIQVERDGRLMFVSLEID